MGLIGRIVGGAEATRALGDAARGVSEVFTANATRRMELGYEAYRASLNEFGEEFRTPREGWFDRFVNGLNRMPRPMLALGTLGLFVYAMIDPAGFARRMVGLGYVPEPLWWLLGAIVSFYFGAREAYYLRGRMRPQAGVPGGAVLGSMVPGGTAGSVAGSGAANPALEEWRALQG